ncbi:MAG: CRTAC1 family protein [Bacteroidota bacterium]
MTRSIMLLGLLCISTLCLGQMLSNYNPFTTSFLIRENEFGTGLSSFDVDEDGWDDYTICSWNTPTRFFKNINGQFVLTKSFPNNKDATACVWSDLDNDGKNDLIVIRRNAKPQLWWQENNFEFSLDTVSLHSDFLPTNSPYSVATGDYNRDGNLDVAITNYSYNFGNRIFTNLGERFFSLGSFGNINYNGVLSFQPAWIDIDFDLYPELYIVNDHSAPCELYKFNEFGFFDNITNSFHLENTSDAMSNSWVDFENDGDFDVFVSNGTNQPNSLSINDNYNFNNQGPNQGLIYPLESWGGLWIDIQNDGWNDLLICTNEGIGTGNLNNKFFLNQSGQLNSIFVSDLHDSPIGYHCAVKADFDNNGTSDVFLSPEYYLANPSINSSQKKALLTSENSNHYLKFRLSGRWSNRNGIGTRYEIHAGELHYVGYTQTGEGYLSQNTQNIICGLGLNTLVDSLILYWPSGIIDKHFALSSDTFVTLEEGETINLFKITPANCLDSLNHVASSIFPYLIWSDSSTDNPYSTNQNNLTVQTNTGFGRTVPLNISIPEYIPPVIQTTLSPPLCPGINNGSISSFLIQNEFDTLSFIHSDSLSHGNHSISHTSDLGCTFTEVYSLEYTSILSIQNISITPTCWNNTSGQIELEVVGGQNPYNNSFNSGIIQYANLPAGNVNISIVDSLLCSIDTLLFIPEIQEPDIIISTDSASSPFYLFTASSPNSILDFLWNNSTSGDSLSLIIEQNQFIQLTATDNLGCMLDTIFEITIPNDVNELPVGYFRQIGCGLFWISQDDLHDFRIFDLSGRIILTESILPSNSQINLPLGIYFIHSRETGLVKLQVQF